MKPYLSITVFLVLLLSALFSSYCSYENQSACLQHEADRALAVALRQQRSDVITPDTVSVYRSNIAIAEIRDTAAISVRMVRIGDRHATVLEADACCPFLTVLRMSDQRMTAVLLLLTALWTVGVLWHRRRHPLVAANAVEDVVSFGGLSYDLACKRFYTAEKEEVRFTPMQHRLMEMFFLSDAHRLPKERICADLWPKKPDASDTLYTLVRRIKPIIEQYGNLHIESDRGCAYMLKDKTSCD